MDVRRAGGRILRIWRKSSPDEHADLGGGCPFLAIALRKNPYFEEAGGGGFRKTEGLRFFFFEKGFGERLVRKDLLSLERKNSVFPKVPFHPFVLTGKVLNADEPYFLQVENELMGMFLELWAELRMPNGFRFSIDCVTGPFVVAFVLAAGRDEPDLIGRQEIRVVEPLKCILNGQRRNAGEPELGLPVTIVLARVGSENTRSNGFVLFLGKGLHLRQLSCFGRRQVGCLTRVLGQIIECPLRIFAWLDGFP